VIACALACATSIGAQAQPNVRIGVTVRPDTVTVGEPFTIVVRVQVPAGSRVEFPQATDSQATVELLDPPLSRAATTVSPGVEEHVTGYRAAAWDVGMLPVKLSPVRVRTAGGDRELSLANVRVFVRSVLPADSAKRIPKPHRPILISAAARPLWWIAVLAAAIVLAVLGWWLWRRRRRNAGQAEVVDPFALAELEFERLEKLGLVEAGERGRFVALAVEVMRDFLARRLDVAELSLTSGELLTAVRLESSVPTDRMATVLGEADLVKFAQGTVSADRAREIAREARAIVRDVHAARARELAAAAERDANRDRTREAAA